MLTSRLVVLAALVIAATAIQPASTTDYNPYISLQNVSINAQVAQNSTSEHFQRRWHGEPPAPADDATWSRFACKGRKLVHQMSLSDHNVAALLPNPQDTVRSPWEYQHLAAWGYEVNIYDDADTNKYKDLSVGGMWGLAEFFEFMGISSKFTKDGGDWIGKMIIHASSRAGQVMYRAPKGDWRMITNAHHLIAKNPHGYIMVQATEGPKSSAAKLHGYFPDDMLPDLGRLSDMIWMNWHDSPDVTKIKFFFSLTITNPVTLSLIRRAMDSINKPLTTAGESFFMNTDAGLAILASPNGAAFAHFLIERKAQIGLKTITSVFVWESESKYKAPSIMFEVANVPPPTAGVATDGRKGSPPSGRRESNIVERDENNVLREHIVYI